MNCCDEGSIRDQRGGIKRVGGDGKREEEFPSGNAQRTKKMSYLTRGGVIDIRWWKRILLPVAARDATSAWS